MNKYEQLVEFIINDENDKARELFHKIVVEKSRDIYESLVADEDLEEMGGNEVEDLVDEVTLDEEGVTESEEGEFDDEIDTVEDHDDTESDEFDYDNETPAENNDDEELQDRVVDLEDALDELKAEFDALMAGEESEEEEFPEIHDDEQDDDNEESIVREYVEKVADTGQNRESGKMAASGARTPTTGGKQTKSTVAAKNDMGGTAAFSKGGNADQNGNSPAATDKPKGTLVSNPQNKPGSSAGKTAFKTKEAPTGSEGK